MGETVRNILVIEDNPADAVLLAEHLRGTGIFLVIFTASTLGEGLKLARENKFNLVLLDLSLPDSRGLDTVRKAVSALPGVPVVVLTGLEDEEIGLDALRLGAQDYLVKGRLTADSITRSARYAIERHRVLQDLREARDHLEEKVKERTAELAKALESLQDESRERIAAQKELREAEVEVLRATEREQRRIGRDLHDSIQGTLAGIDLMLTAQVQAMAVGNCDCISISKKLTDISGLLRQAIRQTRGLSRGLCPLELAGTGLPEALDLAAQTVKSLFYVDCSFRAHGDVAIAEEIVASQVYYIVQEAMTNSLKHAKCKKIDIRLERDGDGITAIIEDDGTGIPSLEERREGLGLTTMNYRARMIGGKIAVERGNTHGTRITLTFPAAGKNLMGEVEPNGKDVPVKEKNFLRG